MSQKLSGAQVLITGASGFLGQHVARALVDSGAKVVPISKTFGFDLRYEAETQTAIFMARPDIVVHLAAPTRIQGRPAAAFRDEVTMGLNVIQAAAMVKAKVVTVMTMSVYPDEAPSPIEEKYLGWGVSKDGAAHAAVLSALDAFRREYKLPSTTLVASEVYGPSPKPGIVGQLLRLMAQMKCGSSKLGPVLKDAQHTMSPVYVSDLARAVVAACSVGDLEHPINLAGSVLKMKEAAEITAKFLDYKTEIKWEASDLPDRWLAKSDPMGRLDWIPEISFETGVAETMPFYLALAKEKTK